MIRKQLIMDQALELFANQGFEATSIQQITDYCGISKGAFYLSFKSKDELIIALLDHFMEDFTSDIDYIVKTTNKSELLYTFYYELFQSFLKHSNFARIFIQEQTHSLHNDFLEKIRYYDTLMDRTILLMIDRLYGQEITLIKYDLMYCVKGFMNMYSKLFLFHNVSLDLDLLVRTLVEKVDILAKHAHTPFVTEELFQISSQTEEEKITEEQLLELLEEKINEINEPIEKESLILLKQHIVKPTLSPAIVKGLLENIQKHDHYKWISYLLRNYLQI